MPGSEGLEFLVILNKSRELRFGLRRVGIRVWVRPVQLFAAGCARVFVGSDETVSIVKIVSLSPRVKNLNLKKVIKVSYLNQECFSDSYACEYFRNIMNVFTNPYISRIRILIYGYIYIYIFQIFFLRQIGIYGVCRIHGDYHQLFCIMH